jgi:formate hydrogenlyase transcriptional activator
MPVPAGKTEAERRIERYEALLRVNDVIAQFADPDQLFKHIAGCLRPIVDFDLIAVGLYDPVNDLARLRLLDAPDGFPIGVGFAVKPDDVPARHLIATQKPVIVRVDDDSPYEFTKKLMRQGGAKVVYHFPLTTSITKLGALILGSQRDLDLSQDEMDFLQRVANQVAIAVENATNFEHVRKAHAELERRNAQRQLLLELTNNVAASLELNDVLRAVVNGLPCVVPCVVAVVALPEGDGVHLRMHAMNFPESRGFFEEGLKFPIDGAMAGKCYSTGRPIVVNQIGPENYNPEMYRRVIGEGIQCQCFLPFVKRGQSLGVMGIARREKNEFTDDEVEFLGQVADQISIALENSFSYEAARKAEQARAKERDRLQLLMDVTNHLTTNLELPDLLKAVAVSLRQLTDSDLVSIHLPTSDGTHLKTAAIDYPGGSWLLKGSPTRVGESLDEERWPLQVVEGTLYGSVFRSGKPFSAARLDPARYPQEVEFLSREGIVGGCIIPLVNRGRVLGNLGLGRREEKPYSEETIDFLMQFGAQVALAIENALSYREISKLKEQLAREKLYLEDEIRSETNFDEIVGDSTSLKSALKKVGTVAASDATVLILGETGTGKELIARAIHEGSKRKGRTFVKLNCAAIPTGLLESELFGHERGAFTGAIAQKIGRMELANGGTLFLDEVGDIPLELQPKLLRALQEREFERLGSTRTQKSDVRFIAATNRDLPKMIADQQFRSDLFYRLNVFPITIPSLRERQGDTPRLVRYFVSKYAKKMDKRIESIPMDAMNKLQAWHWPGNVRELENFIERSVILTTGSVLHVPLAELQVNDIGDQPQITLRDNERDHILRILNETNWVLSGPAGAAARLGLKRTTLQSKMKKLGIARA